jgi:hypothetical protein
MLLYQLAPTDNNHTVISLSAIVITLSIILSMMQQVNYIIAWKAIKVAAYEKGALIKSLLCTSLDL